jgi:hypothetical protein
MQKIISVKWNTFVSNLRNIFNKRPVWLHHIPVHICKYVLANQPPLDGLFQLLNSFIFFSNAVQMVLGIPLEIYHGPFRIGAVYLSGVVTGALVHISAHLKTNIKLQFVLINRLINIFVPRNSTAKWFFMNLSIKSLYIIRIVRSKIIEQETAERIYFLITKMSVTQRSSLQENS